VEPVQSINTEKRARRGRVRRTLGRAFVGSWRLLARVRAKLFSLLAAGSFASFGKGTVIVGPLRLEGERRISIGGDVYLGAGCWLQVLDGERQGIVIAIGDGSSFAGYCVISATESVTFGTRVLVARNVYVSDHMHAFDDAARAVLEQGITRVGAVSIGDGAWLGENVVVGPGVTIGCGAVVGANSVVLDDVPDHGVAVGAPARVVRTAGG
jgi:acetyltransferase-like isoleucine patch superfamily enzyme